LLKPWADANETQIVELNPQGKEIISEPGNSHKMILLVVGSVGISHPQIREWIAALTSRYADVPLVLVSDREDAAEVMAALEARASGFIPTSIGPTVALKALAFIMSGGSFFPPSALTEAARINRPPPLGRGAEFSVVASVDRGGGLTARQQQVLERLTQGASNKLIGRQLRLRESTVKVHVRHIMKKLGATNRTQAALCAASLVASQTESEVNTAGMDQSDPEGYPASESSERKIPSFSHKSESVGPLER
jgi:DNA-binding NarL/FixJ family response regulator